MTTSCWHCEHFRGLTAEGTAALCGAPGCSRVRPDPARGCSACQRVPGIDDEPGPPAGFRDPRTGSWRDLSVTGWRG